MVKVRDSLKETEYKSNRSDRLFLILLAVMVSLAIVVSILFNNYLFFVNIEGSSMERTFTSGETVIVNKTTNIKRGDVVIIDRGNYLVIKRVIALEGDTIRIQDGKVYLSIEGEQEVELVESYLNEPNSTRASSDINLTVRKGEVFYMGDNRVYSRDARQDGCCKQTDVLGVVTPFAIQIKGITTSLFKTLGTNTATE